MRGRYENNHIITSNAETSGHDDGIKSYRDTDLHIEGNYVEQRNPKTGNAQGISAENGTGTFNVLNNVVYGPNTKNALVLMPIVAGSGYWGALRAYNNTPSAANGASFSLRTESVLSGQEQDPTHRQAQMATRHITGTGPVRRA